VPIARPPGQLRKFRIATDVTGMLGLSEPKQETGRSFSLARVEINDAQRDETNGENAHRDDIQVLQAGSCAVRNPPNDFKLS
jgi:hypothetical protein